MQAGETPHVAFAEPVEANDAALFEPLEQHGIDRN